MAKRIDVKRKRGTDPSTISRRPPDGELSPAGSKIVSAFSEAIEAMRSGKSAKMQLSVRTYKPEFACHDYGPDEVRRVRGLLGMSQTFFARFLGVDPNTVRSWEQGTRPPSSMARRFMGEIEADPDYWRKRIALSITKSGSTDPESGRGRRLDP